MVFFGKLKERSVVSIKHPLLPSKFASFLFWCLFIFFIVQWTTVGAVDVNIGANPSAEEGGEDEGVDDTTQKVVDIVDTFRLQEQPTYDKKGFIAYIKKYIKLLTPKLNEEDQAAFKKGIEGATKFLLPKLNDFQLRVFIFLSSIQSCFPLHDDN